MFKKNYNQKKRQQTYLIILFFLLVVFILLLTGLRNNQNIGLKINWLLNKISKTTTWSDIRYGAELYIDEIKQDAVLFFNNNPSKLDKLSIKIKPADLRRIENIVKSKNIKDNLNDEDEKWYPISLSHNSKIYPAKIRIRGDQSIHWINKKKSWKIKFKQENLYKRKKSIDLIIPKERFMEVELTAYTIAKKYGLLVPDSSFILLEQNGKNMGLYFLKEKIDKYFLERNNYPIGEIFTGNDLGLQNDQILDSTSSVNFYGLNAGSYKTQIEDSKEISAVAISQWSKFLDILKTSNEDLINKNIKNYLDIEKFSMWNAIYLIFGNNHAQSINNIKWYYNPITGLFEPVIDDVFLGNESYEKVETTTYNEVINSILKSQIVRDSRLRSLDILVNKEKDFILKTIKDIYLKISPYIYTGAEGYNYNLKGVGLKNPKMLHYTHQKRYNMLKNNLDNLKKSISANRLFIEAKYYSANKKKFLKVDIIHQGVSPVELKEIKLPVDVESFILENSNGYKKNFSPYKARVDKNQDKKETNIISYHNFEFKDLILTSPRYGNYIKKIDKKNNSPIELRWALYILLKNENDLAYFEKLPDLLEFQFENNLTKQKIPTDNINQSKIILDLKENLIFSGKKSIDSIIKEIPNENEQISYKLLNSKIISEKEYFIKNNTVIFPKGDYKILKDLVIPDNFNLQINEGVNFLLSPNVNILLKGGALKIKGTKSNPVLIDSLIPGKNWGTISVLNSKEISNISYSKITNGGSNIKFLVQGVYYTGQINFFHSDVDISNSFIGNANAEDGLNIKKSNFNINNVEFAYNKYDAFDGDWVTGEISNSYVHQNGNDGLDFSGSQVVIRNTIFEKMQDKSLSVGEQSKVDIINCRFIESNYAMAVKDLSKVKIFASSIFNNKIGVAVYRKKPVFGSGTITFIGGLIWANDNNFVTDENAKIILNNTGITQNIFSKNIEQIGLRIGDIVKDYELDEYGNPVPVNVNDLSIIFKRGPNTSGKDLNGKPLPNLSNYHLGMIKPLIFNQRLY